MKINLLCAVNIAVDSHQLSIKCWTRYLERNVIFPNLQIFNADPTFLNSLLLKRRQMKYNLRKVLNNKGCIFFKM